MEKSKRYRKEMLREVYGPKAKEFLQVKETKYGQFSERYRLLQEKFRKLEKKREHKKK